MKTQFSQQGVLTRVTNSYLAALRSQLQPRMLLTILLPVLVAVVAFVLVYTLFFSGIKTALIQWLDAQAPIQQTNIWLENAAAHSATIATVMSWLSMKSFFATIFAMGIMLPFIAVVVFAVMAFAIMPIVVAHLRTTHYGYLIRAGRHAGSYSMLNALKVVLIFCFGWLLTLPLWLIPPFAVLLPIFWWGYAFKGLLGADALATHANSLERRLLFQQYRWDYWLLGLSLVGLSVVPFLWVVLPVFSALLFAHFSLQALSSLRSETAQPDKQALSYD